MKIGMIGLGKMGYNLALNMKDNGIDVIGYNRSIGKVESIREEGVEATDDLDELLGKLDSPRILWMMIPAGEVIDEMIRTLLPKLSNGDILIDGGNSFYRDTLRRKELLATEGIHYVDAGTSGGQEGARQGACMMVGGDDPVIEQLQPVFERINVENGYLHTGPTGSGHFVKMVHNGIEYGMMQAIGEGFDLLGASEFDLDFEAVARVWANGSIIEGLLMRLTERAFARHGNALGPILPIIDATGEGKWTVEEGIRMNVPMPVITSALFVRNMSKDEQKLSNKVVAALRNEFGGHALHKK